MEQNEVNDIFYQTLTNVVEASSLMHQALADLHTRVLELESKCKCGVNCCG